MIGARLQIKGTVQGVGFRPFVYGLAARLGLAGWVRNTSAGVEIEVDGPPAQIAEFARLLRLEQPPLARIDALELRERPANGFTGFEIVHSEPVEGAFQPVSPDMCVCPDCLRELFDPHDRRYHYPFLNCTNCGPRFTIIQDIPYDRPKTTMAPFEMCPACAAEYANPLDRRFHAQPTACPVCGPEVWLEIKSQVPDLSPDLPLRGDQAIEQTRRFLAEGNIVAVKGLGGFHLACAALNAGAVAELRRRKLRVDKPFALMMPDLETVSLHCEVSPEDAALLASPPRPIVLLRRKPGSPIAREVAPGQDFLGVMLPYTPLHYLLLKAESGRMKDGAHPDPASTFPLPPSILVMTSGNLSEEPIATGNQEARERLAALADAFLMHNREIHMRCDDSVVRVLPRPDCRPPEAEKTALSGPPPAVVLRRARGYAPEPLLLPWELPPLLAAGAELKNTFCLARERYAFVSHHIGDLENYETLRSFEEGLQHFERLFRIRPAALAYDLHPNYLATRYALERAAREGLPAVGVQHHHAHIAAAMAEHGLPDEPVIGVAFDGTGYGEDGRIWGGEFLVASYAAFERPYHLAETPLPGGDAAVRKPARAALAHLWAAGLEWQPGLPCVEALCVEERLALRSQLEHRLNAPLTSSLGRLFDAAAAAAGVRQQVNYEAQAAIEFEAQVDPGETGAYPFELEGTAISPAPLWAALVNDVLAGQPVGKIAARFHLGVAQLTVEVCQALRKARGLQTVVLSGGVWQNFTLLGMTLPRLEAAGFTVFLPWRLPPNDGGLSLGQAVVAYHQLKK